MASRKKVFPGLTVPHFRFGLSIPTKMQRFFSARISEDYASPGVDSWRTDQEEYAIGYESGWPSNCKKMN
jgi:hypothetical protein